MSTFSTKDISKLWINKKLHHAQNYLNNILAIIPEQIYWMDKEGKIIGCNEQQAKVFGMTSEELMGKNIYDVAFKLKWDKSISDKIRANDVWVMQNRESMSVEEVIGISIDITERRAMEEKLQAARLKEALQKQQLQFTMLAPGNLYAKNRDGTYQFLNHDIILSNKTILSKEAVGKTVYDFLPKEAADKIHQTDEEVMSQDKEMTLEENGFNQQGRSAIYLSHKIPIHDDQGKVTGMLGLSVDITEQKRIQAELDHIKTEQYEQQIRTLQLMGGAMAHELRHPLLSMHGKLRSAYQAIASLKEKIEEKLLVKSHEAIEGVNHDISRARLMIDMFLKAINPAGAAVSDDINDYPVKDSVLEAVETYPLTEAQKQWIHLALQNDFHYRGSKLFFIHVLYNLMKNALHYIQEVGHGEIYISLRKTAQSNQLIFRDTGQGIKPEDLPHVFEWLYSRTRHGTGLGLYFCQQVIKSLGGEITCHSVYGEYTEFVLTFPLPSEA